MLYEWQLKSEAAAPAVQHLQQADAVMPAASWHPAMVHQRGNGIDNANLLVSIL
jgi:hypothetical protein